MTVLRHDNGNIGGVNPVQYIFREDVQSFFINPVTLIGVITLKAGKAWNYLYGSPETIQLDGKEEETPSGMKYSYQIKMMVPKDRSEVEIVLQNLNYRHLIINLVDKNGVSRYFGTMDCPMKKISKLSKPPAVEGYHGWEVVFTGDFTSPACYQPAVFPPFEPPPPDGT